MDYVMLRHNDGRVVAHEASGYDMLGGGRIFTRAEIDREIAIGASVTYYAVPPAVKVDGLTRGQAVALWAGGATVLALIARWLRG
jgi:hypothetical protein